MVRASHLLITPTSFSLVLASTLWIIAAEVVWRVYSVGSALADAFRERRAV